MPGHQLTMLIPQSARDAHTQLLAALGTEANPAQWMTFMDTVTRLLPEVLSAGRPPKEVIQRCAIGQLGFTSWTAMVEAPTDHGGLGWNESGWKAWRRSWTVVQAHPWLRHEPLTSSEVNTIALDCKRDGVQFPSSAGELEAIRTARKDAQEAKRAESVQSLTLRAETAEKGVQAATAQVVSLSDQLAHVQAQLATALGQVAQQAEAIGTLKAEKSQAETDRDSWKTKAQAKPKPAPAPETALPKGFWQRLWDLLTGK
ncbi:hypothetical protein JET76_28565 [Pseudomonas putida]|uniref:hypothetical protein n=1 Tax=Pseudomonas putida TaxID=303 RepID=UPI0018E6D8D8|nr:hypothetical protein [Pseudomonas putida]MBI6945258.1 hypothetical protein [Pseudomonas putida]MBI6961571.1 hypothetical protein [Pseudomonas putida]